MNSQTESQADAALLYRQMVLIRRSEERILKLFAQGKIGGTTHTCIGQEANAVGVIGQLDSERDHVISNHRCHGHYLAFGGPLEGLFGEVMGRTNGVCGGRGGSQHLKYGRFSSNGVLGGGVPIACGLALGEKLRGTNGIVVMCMGDGALGEGTVYESMNLAALWHLPILFLVENNRYAQTTPLAMGVAGSIVDRARPFGIAASEMESHDAETLRDWAGPILDAVRGERKPHWAVIHTHRFSAHSKGDDTRSAEEIAEARAHDSIALQAERVAGAEVTQIEAEVGAEIDAAVVACEQAEVACAL